MIHGGRDQLAGDQARLVAALVAGADPPRGFDPAGIDATARVLRRKRAHGIAGAWPAFAAEWGAGFEDDVATWAATHPPTEASSRVDGARFLVEHRHRATTPAARAEVLTAHALDPVNDRGPVRVLVARTGPDSHHHLHVLVAVAGRVRWFPPVR